MTGSLFGISDKKKGGLLTPRSGKSSKSRSSSKGMNGKYKSEILTKSLDLRRSVAQVTVMKKLDETLVNDKEFLELFK